MPKLILLRHLKSKWNQENRFTGWVDVPLAKEGIKQAKAISGKVFKRRIDTAYSSPLLRNQNTLVRLLDYVDKYPIFNWLDKGRMKDWGNYKDISKDDIPVYISEALNERYYGKLQGMNKDLAKKKYGEKRVQTWRRGYDTPPLGGESLKDTFRRTVPFFKKYIERDLRRGKNVLVVASHNSLRAIIKHVEKVSDEDIFRREIPYGGIVEYDFDKKLNLKSKKIL
jgi:2,3-bisphosphoglycerate-dependent phosphoglycerate mutase